MNIQIPIIGQQTRVGNVPQDYQSPILVDDARGAALQSFGASLGDLAGGVAAWKKRQATTTVKTTEQQAGPGGPLSASPTTESSGNPPPEEGAPGPNSLSSHYVPTDPVARQDFAIAKSNACLAVPSLRVQSEQMVARLKQNLDPGLTGLVPQACQKFDEMAEQGLQACTTPESRLYYLHYAKETRAQLAGQCLASEAGAAVQLREANYRASVDKWAPVVSADPTQFDTALTALHHGMPALDPGAHQAARDYARTTLLHAGVTAAMRLDPRGTYQALIEAAQGSSGKRGEEGQEGKEGGGGGTGTATGGNPVKPESAALRSMISIMTPAEHEHYTQLAHAAVFEAQARDRETLKTRAADASASYMATGTASDVPLEADFVRGFGEEEGRRMHQQLQATARAGQVHQFVRTLPARALGEMRSQADPATQEGATVLHVIGEVEKARRADPVGYALQNGSYRLAPITSFDDAEALKAELGKRARAAESIRRDYQTTATVLSKQEGLQLAKTLQGKPPEAQLDLLKQITEGIGDSEARDIALRNLSVHAPALAVAGQCIARDSEREQDVALGEQPWGGDGEPDIADLLCRGQALIDADIAGVNSPDAPMPDNASFAQTITDTTGDLFTGSPGSAQVLLQASKAIYAGLRFDENDRSADYNPQRGAYAVKLAASGMLAQNDATGANVQVRPIRPDGADAPAEPTPAAQSSAMQPGAKSGADTASSSSKPAVNDAGLTDDQVMKGKDSPLSEIQSTMDHKTKTINVTIRVGYKVPDYVPEAEATRLKELAMQGIAKFWSRDVEINGEKWTVKVTPQEDDTFGLQTNLTVTSLENPNLSTTAVNTGKTPGNTYYFTSPAYYKNRFGVDVRPEDVRQVADHYFQVVSAHEIGHPILYAAKDREYSWGHKGTSSLIGNRNKGLPVMPGVGEIDLMKYYQYDLHPTEQHVRTLASPSDVKNLIFVSKRK